MQARHTIDESCRWLQGQAESMSALLESLVNIDSGSGNRDGIAEVTSVIEQFLTSSGIDVERVETPAGSILRCTLSSSADTEDRWLLMGHMDTVFPNGTAERRPFHRQGAIGYGPGVADMKAGLVLNCFALSALARSSGTIPPVSALFTCDEEVASPVSKAFVEKAARSARYVLNAEPGRANGNIVIERKGGLFLTLDVTGKAAHAGVDFHKGASAIDELAAKVGHLRGLSDNTTGVTLNVGLISGGETINTVAPQATARIDLRYRLPEQRDPLIARLQEIAGRCEVPGTRGELRVDGEFLPLQPDPETQAMLASYGQAAEALGFAVEGAATGGCSDAGFASAAGAATLCGVGPVGGNAHTEDEYCDLSSLVPRTQALVATILGHAPHRQHRFAPESGAK